MFACMYVHMCAVPRGIGGTVLDLLQLELEVGVVVSLLT